MTTEVPLTELAVLVAQFLETNGWNKSSLAFKRYLYMHAWLIAMCVFSIVLFGIRVKTLGFYYHQTETSYKFPLHKRRKTQIVLDRPADAA